MTTAMPAERCAADDDLAGAEPAHRAHGGNDVRRCLRMVLAPRRRSVTPKVEGEDEETLGREAPRVRSPLAEITDRHVREDHGSPLAGLHPAEAVPDERRAVGRTEPQLVSLTHACAVPAPGVAARATPSARSAVPMPRSALRISVRAPEPTSSVLGYPPRSVANTPTRWTPLVKRSVAIELRYGMWPSTERTYPTVDDDGVGVDAASLLCSPGSTTTSRGPRASRARRDAQAPVGCDRATRTRAPRSLGNAA